MLILRIFHKHDIKFEGEGYDEKYPDDRDIQMYEIVLLWHVIT